MDKIGVIIPALEKNTYHGSGDLAPFGDVTLLDWKIAQIKQIFPGNQIYVSSPSKRIGALAGRRDINFIQREENLSLTQMISFSISQITEETALWANVTSPFVGPADYLQYIQKFKTINNDYDSLATTFSLHEYMFYLKKPLNFQIHGHISRQKIEPLYVITNGCFIIKKKPALELKTYFGRKPFLLSVDRLTAMEIKDLTDLNIANDLIALYFRKKEINTK